MAEVGNITNFCHFLGLNRKKHQKITRNLVKNSSNPRFFRKFAPKETKICLFHVQIIIFT